MDIGYIVRVPLKLTKGHPSGAADLQPFPPKMKFRRNAGFVNPVISKVFHDLPFHHQTP